MKFTQYFFMAVDNMAQHKLRTLLTLLGLIVGISSVLVMTGIGRGFALSTEEYIATLLPNKISIFAGGGSALLTLREVTLLQKLIGKSAVALVVPKKQVSDLPIKGIDPTQSYIMITATTSDYIKTVKTTLSEGRFFLPNEEQGATFVAVVNQSMLNLLQQNGQAQAGALLIDNKPFQIVGVLKDPDNSFGFAQPELYLPINLFPRYLSTSSIFLDRGSLVVDEVVILSTDVPQLSAAKREVEQLLRLIYGLLPEQENSFYINDENQFLEFNQNFSQGFTLVLAGIGAVALLVGGIGIMNILLASITERTREIGVRKAIGASNFDILMQFLIESIVICLLGGGLGVGFSYGLGAIINQLSGDQNMIGLRVVIDVNSVFIAAFSSIACGVIFGLYPALRAMRLNPIEALRYG